MSKSYNKVIVGVDGSKLAETALKGAIAEAKIRDSPLVIVNVMSLPVASNEMLNKKEATMMKNVLENYKAMALKEGVKSVDAKMTMVNKMDGITSSENPIGEGLIAEASKECCSLIVVGTRGHGAATRAVLGSVAEYVLRKNPCDVLVIKC
jgi:nucleotide-binding universal stress UspA family protein